MRFQLCKDYRYNGGMQRFLPKALGVFLWGVLCLCLDGCISRTPAPTLTPLIPGLTPYWTATPSLTPPPETPRPSPVGTAAIPPPPTPTPYTYQVKSGDTMLGIAFRFGITLDELQAANPKVDPRMMSVGTVLVIPVRSAATAAVFSTPTPFPAILSPVRCYPAADQGVWCVATLTNNQAQALEDSLAWMTLYAPDGQVLAGQLVIPPLNLLQPGKSMPVMSYFQLVFPSSLTPTRSAPTQGSATPGRASKSPTPTSTAAPGYSPPTISLPADLLPFVSAQAQLLSALGVAADDPRYLKAEVQLSQQTIDPGGSQARLQGQVKLPAGSQPANTVWVLAVAYGESGEVVGFRKWEAPTKLAPGASLPFDITVYSLGPPIQKLDVLVETRP
jgi:LysM repeat protein